MTEKEISSLMMLCGALNDIAELTREDITCKQLYEVERKIKTLVLHSGLYTKLFYDEKYKFLIT